MHSNNNWRIHSESSRRPIKSGPNHLHQVTNLLTFAKERPARACASITGFNREPGTRFRPAPPSLCSCVMLPAQVRGAA